MKSQYSNNNKCRLSTPEFKEDYSPDSSVGIIILYGNNTALKEIW